MVKAAKSTTGYKRVNNGDTRMGIACAIADPVNRVKMLLTKS